jgi:PqqD family protein of HPr-rel-A system
MVRVWAINSSSKILLEEIDGFLACYVVVTGETHILDAFPAEILRLLASAPQSRVQISEHLATQLGENSGSWVAKIDDTLTELQRLQLVDIQIT